FVRQLNNCAHEQETLSRGESDNFFGAVPFQLRVLRPFRHTIVHQIIDGVIAGGLLAARGVKLISAYRTLGPLAPVKASDGLASSPGCASSSLQPSSRASPAFAASAIRSLAACAARSAAQCAHQRHPDRFAALGSSPSRAAS